MANVHHQLAAARRRADMTQVRLAELIGVGQPTISSVESGRGDTTLRRAEAWAQAVGVQLAVIDPTDVSARVSTLEGRELEIVRLLLDAIPSINEGRSETLAILLEGWMRADRANVK